jgi:hypothetical protein
MLLSFREISLRKLTKIAEIFAKMQSLLFHRIVYILCQPFVYKIMLKNAYCSKHYTIWCPIPQAVHNSNFSALSSIFVKQFSRKSSWKFNHGNFFSTLWQLNSNINTHMLFLSSQNVMLSKTKITPHTPWIRYHCQILSFFFVFAKTFATFFRENFRENLMEFLAKRTKFNKSKYREVSQKNLLICAWVSHFHENLKMHFRFTPSGYPFLTTTQNTPTTQTNTLNSTAHILWVYDIYTNNFPVQHTVWRLFALTVQYILYVRVVPRIKWKFWRFLP